VTSPNGTTERAIAVFDRFGMGSMLDEAFTAAIARARELAGG
jgi:pyrroline-5-carboxylate reductase